MLRKPIWFGQKNSGGRLKERDQSERPIWKVVHQDLYDNSCLRLIERKLVDRGTFIDVLMSIEERLEFDPYSVGVEHTGFAGHRYFVARSPSIARLAPFRYFFEVRPEVREVWMWGLSLI